MISLSFLTLGQIVITNAKCIIDHFIAVCSEAGGNLVLIHTLLLLLGTSSCSDARKVDRLVSKQSR